MFGIDIEVLVLAVASFFGSTMLGLFVWVTFRRVLQEVVTACEANKPQPEARAALERKMALEDRVTGFIYGAFNATEHAAASGMLFVSEDDPTPIPKRDFFVREFRDRFFSTEKLEPTSEDVNLAVSAVEKLVFKKNIAWAGAGIPDACRYIVNKTQADAKRAAINTRPAEERLKAAQGE